MTIRLLKPWAHELFVGHPPKPVYMDCAGPDCRVCRKVEAAKNMKTLDEIVRTLAQKRA